MERRRRACISDKLSALHSLAVSLIGEKVSSVVLHRFDQLIQPCILSARLWFRSMRRIEVVHTTQILPPSCLHFAVLDQDRDVLLIFQIGRQCR